MIDYACSVIIKLSSTAGSDNGALTVTLEYLRQEYRMTRICIKLVAGAPILYGAVACDKQTSYSLLS